MTGRWCAILTLLLAACALSLVTAQYQARRLFIEFERAQAQARELEIAWAQLQLDQSSLSKHARIELHARRDLNMVSLTPDRTQYLIREAK